MRVWVALLCNLTGRDGSSALSSWNWLSKRSFLLDACRVLIFASAFVCAAPVCWAGAGGFPEGHWIYHPPHGRNVCQLLHSGGHDYPHQVRAGRSVIRIEFGSSTPGSG